MSFDEGLSVFTSSLKESFGIEATDDSEVWSCALRTKVKAKWSKPVSRLIGERANGYNAVHYRDAVALHSVFELIFQAPSASAVVAVVQSQSHTEREKFWRLMDMCVLSASGGAIPTHSPSLPQIQEEIERKRKEKLETPVKEEEAEAVVVENVGANTIVPEIDFKSMDLPEKASLEEAVRTLFKKLCDAVTPLPKSSKKSNKTKLRSYMQKLNPKEVIACFRQIITDCPELEDAAVEKDIEPFLADDVPWHMIFPDEKMCSLFLSSLGRVADENEGVMEILSSLLSFSKIESAVPTKVMSRIEDVTSSILSKLKSGKMVIGDLDLEKIGEEVMDGCSEVDGLRLSENFAEILPVIQRSLPANILPNPIVP